MHTCFLSTLDRQSLSAGQSSDEDADADADVEQGEEQVDKAEVNVMRDTATEAAAVAAEGTAGARDRADVMPAEVTLERPGMKTPVTVPSRALGTSLRTTQ